MKQSSDYQATLRYYQQKVDELYKERLGWLSKFDQCQTALQEKHQKQNALKELKDKENQLKQDIVHGQISLFDERINTVKIEYENLVAMFMDAEEIVKFQELAEEFPQDHDKKLTCLKDKNRLYSGQSEQNIENQLNIHCGNKNNKNLLSKESNFNSKGKNNKQANSLDKNTYQQLKRPTVEDILKRQLIQLKTNHNIELELLDQQTQNLQRLIQKVKSSEAETRKAEKEVISKLKKQIKEKQDVYKAITEKYFKSKKMLKQEVNSYQAEEQSLGKVFANLKEKVEKEEKTYEKENKAKQTLIVKRNEDFQEEYKSKMRAKERNLQAMKENYEKVQQICIEKIKQLEETLVDATARLNTSQKQRNIKVHQLRAELNALEKRLHHQTVQQHKLDLKLQEKIEIDNKKRQRLQEREEEERRVFEKQKQIEQAYRRNQNNLKNTKSKSKSKSKSNLKKETGKKLKKVVKPIKQKQNDEEENSSEESQESMAMSDLQNIRNQINELENKISLEQKKK